MAPFFHIDFDKEEEGEQGQKGMLTVVIGPRHYQKTQGCVNGQVLPILTSLHTHGIEYATHPEHMLILTMLPCTWISVLSLMLFHVMFS